MRIAITGGSGGVGRAVVALALAEGHSVVNIDRTPPPADSLAPGVRFVQADITDFAGLKAAMAGCDALIHLAAIPRPDMHPEHEIHNTNVVGSYNAMLGAAELGIRRVCQASSVNAIGHAFSRTPRYDYFPLDEAHPSYNADPYSLSKWIAEQQAASLCRRHDGLQIASLRFHWVTPALPPLDALRPELLVRNLWSYVLAEAAARACLLGLSAEFAGHEAFFIVAPRTALPTPSLELARAHFPAVPIVGEFGGNTAFFSSAKAVRMLGWRHDPEV